MLKYNLPITYDTKNPSALYMNTGTFLSVSGSFWTGGVHVWPLCQMQRSPEASQKPEGKLSDFMIWSGS